MSEFNSTRTVKAVRKVHECEQCGRNINVGDPATYSVGRWEGDIYSFYSHPECAAAAHAYATEFVLWGEDYPWFQHMELEWEDKEWLLDNHPKVAERLNIEREEEDA